MVSKHFFLELTGILLNYDRFLTLTHTPSVGTCGSILLNTKQTAKSENKIIFNKVFSHDVTAAMLVSQTNPVGVELFYYANAFLFQ